MRLVARTRPALWIAGAMFLVVVSAAPAGAATTHEVVIESFTFAPAEVHAIVGDTVRWTNLDGVAHNVSGGPLFSSNFGSGSYQHTFTAPGTFSYICTLHAGMNGQVVVAEVPAEVVPEAPWTPLLALGALAFAGGATLFRRHRAALV